MKYTLLEMVQSIASSMDSDEVNSITDTTESMQIAQVVRTSYFDLISRLQPPEHYDLFFLTASTNNAKPVLMTMPEAVSSIKWLKYDCSTAELTDRNMVEMQYLSLKDFLDRMDSLSPSADNVESMTINSQTFYYTNDIHPTYYTTIDDETLVFDSYDADVDTTLQSSKTRGFGLSGLTFTFSDTFTPDLDEIHFPLLLNEAKALAWAELKQTAHAKAERNAQRGWVNSQATRDRAKPDTWYDSLPNYGRK